MWACRANRGAYSIFCRAYGCVSIRSMECISAEGVATVSQRFQAANGTQVFRVENSSFTTSCSQRDDDSDKEEAPLFEKLLVANRGKLPSVS